MGFDSAEMFSYLKYQRALSTYTTYSTCNPQLNAREKKFRLSGGCQQSFLVRGMKSQTAEEKYIFVT